MVAEREHVQKESGQALAVGGAKESAVDKGLFTRWVVGIEQLRLAGAKGGLAVTLGHALNGGAVDAEHERLEAGIDAGEVCDGFDDTLLEGRCVRDLDQGVDVVEKSLPKLEDLGRARVEGLQVLARHECLVGSDEAAKVSPQKQAACAAELPLPDATHQMVADVGIV